MRIGLLVSNSLSEFGLNTLKPIIEDDSLSIEVAIVDNRPTKSLRQKLKENIRLGRGGYVLIMALRSIFPQEGISVNTRIFCADNGIDVIETKEPYSGGTLDLIRKYKLDVLLLLSGFGIIKEPPLSITPLGVLSYHHGNIREYRGMPPALWELYNDEKEMGVAVQVLAPGLDCGIPVEEKSVEILPKDNLVSLKSRVFKQSENMMYDALKNCQTQT